MQILKNVAFCSNWEPCLGISMLNSGAPHSSTVKVMYFMLLLEQLNIFLQWYQNYAKQMICWQDVGKTKQTNVILHSFITFPVTVHLIRRRVSDRDFKITWQSRNQRRNQKLILFHRELLPNFQLIMTKRFQASGILCQCQYISRLDWLVDTLNFNFWHYPFHVIYWYLLCWPKWNKMSRDFFLIPSISTRALTVPTCVK